MLQVCSCVVELFIYGRGRMIICRHIFVARLRVATTNAAAKVPRRGKALQSFGTRRSANRSQRHTS